MTGAFWNRYVGIAGLLSALLLIGGGIALIPLPLLSATDDHAKVASAVISARGAARSGSLLFLVAMIPFFLFAAGITDVLSREVALSRVLRRAAFGCATATAALFAAFQGAIAAVVAIAQSSTPETVSAMYRLADQIGFPASMFLGLFVLITSILALVAHSLPGWVRWMGVAGGLCLTLGTLALLTGLHVLGPLYLIGWYVSQAWILVTSAWILIGRFSGQPEPASVSGMSS